MLITHESSIQKFLDVTLQFLWIVRRSVPLDRISLLVQEELSKVPLDILAAQKTRFLIFQPTVERMSGRTVHVDTAEERELHAVLVDKLLDLAIRSWFLTTELVAREGQHLESFALVTAIQIDQLFVVLIGKSALRCHVHHQGDLPLEVG